MKSMTFPILTVLALMMVLAACGGKSAPADDKAAAPAPAAATQTAPPAGDNEGVLIAKEILGLFDEAVAEAVALTKDKPEAAALKPQLTALYDKYAAKMAEINPRYLALKTKDVALFGACNSYMGSNRGRHVFEKDNKLTDAFRYYNLEKGEKEIVDFLSLKLSTLIDIADKR